jgi:syntaxin 1B/2/3
MAYNPYAQQNGGANVVRPAGGGYGTAEYATTVPISNVLPTHQFLARVDNVRNEINVLTSNISQIAVLHQRALTRTEPDIALEHLVSRTQVLNASIRDQIKFLEQDAARSSNSTKITQVNALKSDFKAQLSAYQHEEVEYKKRFQEQIARQYRIVNPRASEIEVREAAQADWGNEGVFQTAVSTSCTPPQRAEDN